MPPKRVLIGGTGGIRKITPEEKAANALVAMSGIHTPSAMKSAEIARMKHGLGKLPGARSMKDGGMVKETKLHHLHEGELVVPKHLVKHFSALMKK